jgi:Phosphodiester glycosidase
MNQKNRFLSRGVALCLLVPSTLALTVFEPMLSHAQQKSRQVQTRYSQLLPLGQANLAETRQSTQIAPGVRRTLIIRGEQSTDDIYTVDVAFRATRREAQAIADQLIGRGFEPAILTISKRALDDPEFGPLGYLVRVGAFSLETEAIQLRDRLITVGYTGLRVVYSGEDGAKTTGPWVINVLELDPAKFQGKVSVALSTGVVPGNEQLTQISSQTGALAAINGGYFVIGAADGTPGDLAGISIIGGRLVSEAVNGRTSLILPSRSGKNARIAALTTELRVTATNRATREIDGLNRKPGLIRGCGGVGGDLPTELPKHDFTCKDDSELIQFTQAFGQTTEPGDGVEVVLDASNRVVEFRSQRGGQIPADGSVLAGTGDAAEWLQANAVPGTLLSLKTRLLADHQRLPLRKTLEVVNGGPRLLRDGKLDIPAFAEGFQQPENPEFYYRFGVRRNPRTLAGVTASGKLLLVAVDGRRPGYSVGASFIESARILRSLGAIDAVNLDGGGSTTLTIDQQLVNRPSDATGERPIGDAIILQP